MTNLDAFWVIRNAAESQRSAIYSERTLSGELALSPENIEALNVLENAGNLPNLWISDRLCTVANLPLSGTARFEAQAPRGYYETLDELIRRHRLNPPEPLRVFNLLQEDELLPKYCQAAALAGLLSDLAVTRSAEDCTIMAKTQLDIPFNYSVGDLCERPQIEAMREKLNSSTDLTPESKRMLDLYRSLFLQAVYDTVGSLPKAQRFSHLLENFAECVFRFNLAFRCFSDEANKAIERYEEKRAGMIGALNGVLGNIQTSLIGVPLAGLLALKEIKPAEGLTFPNFIICVSVLVVGGLLLALSFSQGKTLEAIGEQESQLRSEIRDCGGGNTKIGRLLVSMSNHHSLVYRLLVTVRAIIVVLMLIAVGTFIWCIRSPEAKSTPNLPPESAPATNKHKAD